MIPAKRVAIVGLGMIGGSLARALASRGVHVIGYDSARDSLDAAEREGIVSQRMRWDFAGIETAEIVVLATPVDVTLALLPRIAAHIADARLVMDVASTKSNIVATAENVGLGAKYVGAHPLTGSHRSGWLASRAELFHEARVFLCPASSATAEALQLAEEFWRGLHAGVEVLDAVRHDVQMAWRSHLPHVLSSALAVTLRESGIPRSALGPGGRDMTRLAGGPPSLWASIVEDNESALTWAVEAVEDQLRGFREALSRRDSDATREFLARGAEWFDGEQDSRGADSSLRSE